jgi:hypothetical protein
MTVFSKSRLFPRPVKLVVEGLPVGADAGIADKALFAASFGHSYGNVSPLIPSCWHDLPEMSTFANPRRAPAHAAARHHHIGGGATNRGVETSVREAFNLDLASVVVREICWSG